MKFTYTCKKCSKKFKHQDPAEPERKLITNAQICPACRNSLYIKNTKKTIKYILKKTKDNKWKKDLDSTVRFEYKK